MSKSHPSSNQRLIWERDYVIWLIRRFLQSYDKFLDERSIEANMRCNDAIERLRDVVDEHDSMYNLN